MFTLNDCYEYVKQGWLTQHESTDGKLVGFKYSLATVYEQHWDEITLSCRGIVFEKATGHIVAHPFNKFFNYQEVYAQDGSYAHIGKILSQMENEWRPFTSNEFTIAEKVDGSLGIAYFYEGEWHVKTGGSFNSEQAIWATNFLRKNLHTSSMAEGLTYCFEIVYKGDQHVVHYDTEEMVLLGAIGKFTGREVPRQYIELDAQLIGCRCANEYKFSSLEETLAEVAKMDVNHEGVVMTFFDGEDTFKVKIKSEEYLEMFHRMSCITYKEIRDHFDYETGMVSVEYAATIPEELVEMKQYVEKINEMVTTKFEICKKIATVGALIEVGRSRYEYVSQEAGYLAGATMAMIKYMEGKGTMSAVYRSIFQKVKEDLKEI